MASSLNTLALRLKSLHTPTNPVLFANVYDAPSAKTVASNPLTTAIATASYAIAASRGLEDDDLTLPINLSGIQSVVAGVRNAGKLSTLPISADLQDGYEDISSTIKSAIALGVVGANIEDLNGAAARAQNGPVTLRTPDEAADRIRAAMTAAAEAGVPDFVINARTDTFGYGGTISDAILRGKKYLAAGATTVFVWGTGKHKLTLEEVREMVQELDGRVSVLGYRPGEASVEELLGAGVSRISVGPLFAVKAWKAFEEEVGGYLEVKENLRK